MAEISIIIPIYQTEAFLQQCLDSVAASEMFQQCEVLMIDDGSTDSGPEIARKAAEKFSNMRLFRYENGGLSEARNRGLRLAQGRYVFFLDSDDMIEPDYLTRLYSCAQRNESDIVWAGFSETDEDGNVTGKVLRPVLKEQAVIDGSAFLERRMDSGDWLNQAWCALYRRSFLMEAGLTFQSEIRLYEDVVFTNEATVSASRISCVEAYGYLYRIRNQSLVHSGIGERDVSACIQVLRMMVQRCQLLSGERKRAYGRALIEHASMTMYHIGMSEVPDKGRWFAEMRRLGVPAAMLSCATNRKEWIKYIIFVCCPRMYYPLTRKG